MKFVELEAKIANDPVFSRGVLGKIQVPERGKDYERDNPLYKQNNRASGVSKWPKNHSPLCKETYHLDGCLDGC